MIWARLLSQTNCSRGSVENSALSLAMPSAVINPVAHELGVFICEIALVVVVSVAGNCHDILGPCSERMGCWYPTFLIKVKFPTLPTITSLRFRKAGFGDNRSFLLLLSLIILIVKATASRIDGMAIAKMILNCCVWEAGEGGEEGREEAEGRVGVKYRVGVGWEMEAEAKVEVVPVKELVELSMSMRIRDLLRQPSPWAGSRPKQVIIRENLLGDWDNYTAIYLWMTFIAIWSK